MTITTPGRCWFHDCFLPRGARRLKSWFGEIGRAWEGMFDCCGGGDRKFVRVGNRIVPRGRRVTNSEWKSLEARKVVVLNPKVTESFVNTRVNLYPTEESTDLHFVSNAETQAMVRKLSWGESRRSWLELITKIRWVAKIERAGYP